MRFGGLNFLWLQSVQAHGRAIAWIGQAVARQATLISQLDVFWCAAIFALVMVPFALTLKSSGGKGGPETASGHKGRRETMM